MTLPEHLSVLESSGIILLAQVEPELEFYFRHALVHDAAYQSLVRRDRRRLHRAAGEALEALHAASPNAPALAPALARHFEEAGEPARALRYYREAAQAAAAVYANHEADDHYRRALELALALPDPAAVVDLTLRRGRVLELSAQDTAALEAYQALETWAQARGDDHARLAALNARATIYVKPSVTQDQAQGAALSHEAIALARQLGDRPAEAKALWNLSQHHLSIGQFGEAITHGEQSLAIAREVGDREQTAYVLTDLIKVYFMTERNQLGLEALEEARALWRELGQLNMLADNLGTTAMLNIITGDYPTALARSAEAVRVSRSIGNVWNESYAYYLQDMLHFDQGDVALALAAADNCRRLAEQAGFSEGLSQTAYNLGLIYQYMGAPARAIEALTTARSLTITMGGLIHGPVEHMSLLAMIELGRGQTEAAVAALAQTGVGDDTGPLREQFYLTYVMYVQAAGAVALHTGRPEHAAQLTSDLLEHLHGNQLTLFRPDVLYLHAVALRAAGRAVEAEAALDEARTLAEALGSRRMLWLILAEQAKQADDEGRADEAQALRAEAAGYIRYIAAHAGDEELAEGFRRRPEVQAVLAAGDAPGGGAEG